MSLPLKKPWMLSRMSRAPRDFSIERWMIFVKTLIFVNILVKFMVSHVNKKSESLMTTNDEAFQPVLSVKNMVFSYFVVINNFLRPLFQVVVKNPGFSSR